MAGFADDATASLGGIERPMSRGQPAGGDVDAEMPRSGGVTERLMETDRERGEAAVETDHEREAASGGLVDDRVDVRDAQCQRLLDPRVTTGAERGEGGFRMIGVARRDEDRLDGGVSERRRGIGADRGRAVLVAEEAGRCAARRDDMAERDGFAAGGEGGKQRGPGEDAGAEDGDAHAFGLRRSERHRAREIRLRMHQQAAEPARGAEVRVERWRVPERHAARDERADLQVAGGDPGERAGEVVGRRTGARAVAGPVGVRDAERHFVGVERGAVETEADDADQHHGAAEATHARRVVDGGVRGGAGGDDHAGRALPFRPAHDGGDRIALLADLDAVTAGERPGGGVRIEAERHAAHGAEQLGGKLPDQAEAHDSHAVAGGGG